jgi:glycosyltransferase involved in cell wall biosynthesis
MNDVLAFFKARKIGNNEYIPSPGSNKTILISSYIWWTELIAFAIHRLGYNVLIVEPWYMMWIDDNRFANFDRVFRDWVTLIKRMNVQLVIGGNSTISVPHPKTKELLHRAAGVPAVSLWWDEPRTMPPMTKRGLTGADHLAAMRDDRTLNVFWDIDVAEQMQKYYGVGGVHVPLGATPEFWQSPNAPLAQRPVKLCFLGNNHDEGTWQNEADAATMKWARDVAALKIENLDRPMVSCIDQVGAVGGGGPEYALAADLKEEFNRWNILGAVLLTERRNAVVKAAAERLPNEFLLVGKGWERMGLKAQREHSGVPAAKDYYANSKASLNLFGGCVHGGMPLRPYEIAASNGLLFTQYNRELPGLFCIGKECVSFRNADEMVTGLDRILAAPAEFDAVVHDGRKRVCAEHTWEHRMKRVLDYAKDKFGLPW